jgi:UDP-galactose transporter
VGVAAVMMCALSSAIAGVIMEKYLKDENGLTFLSTKNVYLSFISVVIIGFPTAAQLWSSSLDDDYHGFLHGVDGVVVVMILNQAVGGILVALTLRHADSILKSFATTLAIIVAGVASNVIFAFVPSAFFVVGSLMVVMAVTIYALPERC